MVDRHHGVGQALEDLAAALRAVGARVEEVGRPAPDRLLARPGPGAPAVAIRAVGASRADPVHVAPLLRGNRGPATVLVADLVPDQTRQLLREAGWGWLDRRGQLRVLAPGLLVDTAVPALERPRVSARRPISGRGGTTWAAALLLDPDRPPVLREVARRSGLAASTLSAAAAALRGAELVGERDRPVLPDLFWALAEAWRPAWECLARRPEDGSTVIGGWAAARAAGAEAPTETAGAPMGTERLARAAGAPGAVDLYVAGPAEVSRLVRACGRCHPGLEAARVAVMPTPLVAVTAGAGGVAAGLFAALDIAGAQGGVQTLGAWQPTDGTAPVWR